MKAREVPLQCGGFSDMQAWNEATRCRQGQEEQKMGPIIQQICVTAKKINYEKVFFLNLILQKSKLDG